MPPPTLKALDLFSGLGGIGMALRGIAQTTAYCEIEPYAVKMLENNMRAGRIDRAPVHSDVRALTAKDVKGVDIIVAGFPCTGFSNAGHRQGFKNSGSSLFYEVVRLIELARPSLVFLENVSAIVRMGLDTIIKELNGRLGYEVRWVCALGFHVGGVSKRRRWFCLAIRRDQPKQGLKLRVGDYTPFFSQWRAEPPPRLIQGKSPPGVIRFGVIGNSVMPDVVRLAFLFLASGGRVRNLAQERDLQGQLRVAPVMIIDDLRRPRKNRDGSEGDMCGVVDFDGHRVTFANPFPRLTPANFRLRFTPTGAKASDIGLDDPVFKNAWATPRHSNTSPCRVFTERCLGDLPTQLVFEEKTPVSHRTAASGYVINPEFAEWVMGLPRGASEYL